MRDTFHPVDHFALGQYFGSDALQNASYFRDNFLGTGRSVLMVLRRVLSDLSRDRNEVLVGERHRSYSNIIGPVLSVLRESDLIVGGAQFLDDLDKKRIELGNGYSFTFGKNGFGYGMRVFYDKTAPKVQISGEKKLEGNLEGAVAS